MIPSNNLFIQFVKSDFDSQILLNLLQKYEEEFSKITKKIPDENGIYKLDVNLTETDNYIFLVSERPVGFCIKGNSAGRHDIFEFYIEPNSRNQKLGSKFAHLIFKKYPGQWQVRQISGAVLAKKFFIKGSSLQD